MKQHRLRTTYLTCVAAQKVACFVSTFAPHARGLSGLQKCALHAAQNSENAMCKMVRDASLMVWMHLSIK